MRSTTHTLRLAAHIITHRGLHTDDQFADRLTRRVDICAAIYLATQPYQRPERLNIPAEFFTDEGHAITLIEANPQAMQAIRTVSAAITNYLVPDTDGQPDVIEHVSNWVRTPPIGCTTPPSMSEVIGCILRAARQAHTPHPNAA
ncbi:hypothetical protein PV402_39700 [Streptomyces scabiei]|uniref:DUF6197 family protein n=1 Tax=Streptomyces scabiei TaxID=1930 RepID=UPI0029B476E0|nr:hypothetical protein [Streptomyces scabiei]MDX2658313.1 hypothetical protein [Streptomyces scabiei]MDX2870598.1 hypothetical protein [Streptomyces scabiei]